jgi:hypothetical protein
MIHFGQTFTVLSLKLKDIFISDGSDGSGGGGSSENLVFQAPQAVREDYIQNAVKFLEHPKVKGSPVSYRYSFLEKKGLTKEEIDEAFRRVPVSV